MSGSSGTVAQKEVLFWHFLTSLWRHWYVRPRPNSGHLCPSPRLRSDRSFTFLAHLVQELWNKMCFCHFSTRPLHTSAPVTPKGHMEPHALCYADVSQFDGEHFGTGPVSVSRAVFFYTFVQNLPKNVKNRLFWRHCDVTATPNRDRIWLRSRAPPSATQRHHCRFRTTIRSGVIPKKHENRHFFVSENHVFRDLHPIPMGAHFPYFLVGRSKVALFVISKSVCRSDRPFSTYSRFALSKIYYYEYIDMLEQSSK